MGISREDISIKTIDGLTLRGWLYPAADYGPAVIITPGVSSKPCLKQLRELPPKLNPPAPLRERDVRPTSRRGLSASMHQRFSL